MNEKIREIAEQAGSTHKQNLGVYQFYSEELEKFAELIVKECAETIQDFVDHRFPASEYPIRLKRYFGIESATEDREHIGYTEREEGFYKLYAPPKGSIVTQAFILCKYCNSAIYHCSGPKVDAVCFDCYDKEPELR